MVLSFINRTADDFIRKTLASSALLPPRRGRHPIPLPEQLLHALSTDSPALVASAEALDDFYHQIQAWLAQLQPAVSDAPFRTCFRIDAPTNAEEEDKDWHVRFMLQAKDDRSLLIPAEDVWNTRSNTLTFLKRRFENPQEQLLADLGKASHVYPAIETSLETARPVSLDLNTEDVEAAIAFFKKKQSSMSLGEAMQLGLGADTGYLEPEVGLPVVEVETEGWLEDMLSRLSGERLKVTPIKTPGTFKGKLRPYQVRGVSWLAYLSRFGLGACLADDMGLRKTIELIALMLHERSGKRRKKPAPTLLICPMSVVGNWQKEVERFGPSLKVMVHHGTERLTGEIFAREAKKHDFVITTYALANRDEETLAGVQWQHVVLDEAQSIKNPTAKRTQAIKKLNAEHRIALTGTPVENRLSGTGYFA